MTHAARLCETSISRAAPYCGGLTENVDIYQHASVREDLLGQQPKGRGHSKAKNFTSSALRANRSVPSRGRRIRACSLYIPYRCRFPRPAPPLLTVPPEHLRGRREGSQRKTTVGEREGRACGHTERAQQQTLGAEARSSGRIGIEPLSPRRVAHRSVRAGSGVRNRIIAARPPPIAPYASLRMVFSMHESQSSETCELRRS